jgi:hypothetical protein
LEGDTAAVPLFGFFRGCKKFVMGATFGEAEPSGEGLIPGEAMATAIGATVLGFVGGDDNKPIWAFLIEAVFAFVSVSESLDDSEFFLFFEFDGRASAPGRILACSKNGIYQ